MVEAATWSGGLNPVGQRHTRQRGPQMPALLQGIQIIARPTEFFEACARRYGPNFVVRFPNNRPLFLISDPDAIKAIFAGDPDQLRAGENNIVLKPIVGANSLLLLDGQRHRRDRKLMMPMFHGERMRAYGQTMLEIVTRQIDAWPVGREFSFHAQMQVLTLEIILATVFGVRDQAIAPLRQALEELLTWGNKSWFLLFIDGDGNVRDSELGLKLLGRRNPKLQFEAVRGRVNDLLFAEFQRRRREADWDRPDVLSMLMQARFDDGSVMSDEELRDEMMTLLLAGHETTATSLSWLLTWLYQYPGVLQNIRAEVAELGQGGPVPADKIAEMAYTMAAIKESLRRTPVIPLVGRKLQSDTQIGPLFLPAGTLAAPNIYLTHHRADIWGDPYRFRPERFLENPAKPYHFFPFGGGNRTCLGMAFAYYEMKIAIGEIVRRCKFRLATGYVPKLLRRNITFAPSKGVPVIIDAVVA